MKLTLNWQSDTNMRALFSNIGCKNKNDFYLLMVFHKSKKNGFDNNITTAECLAILQKENPAYQYLNSPF